ncbi:MULTISPECIES: hypothetical protein [unclassified Paraburkholderia]|uniref:hypothetical protein n=1 Tax=unclassified Paraburkholderia TaxID=2615204 RepID=UPI002AAFE596|nr:MULTISPECIES: hypothetical protein [unclassified Paraburkholderia]
MNVRAAYIEEVVFLPDDECSVPAGFDTELCLVTSSAEVGILGVEQALALLRRFYPSAADARSAFVSIGCAGFFGCVLEFLASDAESATLVLLETPSWFVQETLDGAGVGYGGDGFIAKDSACVVRLGRTPRANALRIDFCTILAKPARLLGTVSLAREIVGCLAALYRSHPALQVVTFANVSAWSQRLVQLVDMHCPEIGLSGSMSWMPSVESDATHYMSVRPLLDLRAHEAQARERPLLLTCLGAGGRLGMLLVAPPDAPHVPHPSRAAPLPIHSVPAPHRQTARSASRDVLYAKPEYFGQRDFYFKWNFDHADSLP